MVGQWKIVRHWCTGYIGTVVLVEIVEQWCIRDTEKVVQFR
jgi:hypothetical protein